MSYIVGIGEMMLRLSSLSGERLLQNPLLNATFGGVEVNVCVSASRFGLKSRFVTAFPDNAIAKKAEELILSHRVDTSCIVWEGNRLGVYFLDSGCDCRASSIIYDRENSALSKISYERFDWDNIFKDASILHVSGVTAGVSENAKDLILYSVKEAKKRNVKVSCDINYRTKLWKYGKEIHEVMPEIVEYTDILFANEYDMINILGVHSNLDYKDIVEDNDYISLVKDTMRKYNLSTIVSTKRKVITSSHNLFSSKCFVNDTLYKSREADINNIVDRVGTGDAFVAGFLSALSFFDDYNDIINFATSSAAIKHTIYGDWNLVSKEEVIGMMNSGFSDVRR